jgi:hypothetical protein
MRGRASASERLARRGADPFFGDPINVMLGPDGDMPPVDSMPARLGHPLGRIHHATLETT